MAARQARFFGKSRDNLGRRRLTQPQLCVRRRFRHACDQTSVPHSVDVRSQSIRNPAEPASLPERSSRRIERPDVVKG